MSTFPTDAEREAIERAYADPDCLCGTDGCPTVAEALIDALAPSIAARERQAAAEAWDEGAEAAWERSTAEVNASRYHWRSEGEPRNPYRAAEGGGSDE